MISHYTSPEAPAQGALFRKNAGELRWRFSREPSKNTLVREHPKAPLADQGELSRASPASTRLRGSEFPHFDNPSVMALRETAMTAPFTQGSRGAHAPVRFLMVLGRTGGLPHQSADWFAMTLSIPVRPPPQCHMLSDVHWKSTLSFTAVFCPGRNHQIHPSNSMGNDVFCVGAVKSGHTRQKEVAFGA